VGRQEVETPLPGCSLLAGGKDIESLADWLAKRAFLGLAAGIIFHQ